jgi:hypothetical protein
MMPCCRHVATWVTFIIMSAPTRPTAACDHRGTMVIMGSRFWSEAQWQGSWVAGPANGTSWCPAPLLHAGGCSQHLSREGGIPGLTPGALASAGGSPSAQSSSSNSWDVGAYASDTVVVPPHSLAVVRLVPERMSCLTSGPPCLTGCTAAWMGMGVGQM